MSTKLEYGTLPLQKQKIDPVKLERRVVSEFLNNGLPEKFVIRVEAETSDTPLSLHGDITLLHRMLYNLVSNSIVHNPDGCEIELSVSTAENSCVFSVVDTGCGMKDWQIERLNADESIGSMQPGDKQEEHGLGLKIVRQIAKAHQGKVIFSQDIPSGLYVKTEIPTGLS